MADERTYIKVHDGIEDHPKTAALSDKAFRLLVTTWGWCSRHRTDGQVPIAVWNKRGTKAARDQLVAAGLAILNDRCVVMHDYLEHQRSAKQIADDVAEKKRGGRLGNHRRWHVERGFYDATCEFCQESGPPEDPQPPSDTDRSTDRFQESPHRSPTDRSTSPDTDTDKGSDRDTRSSLPVGDARERGAAGPNSTAAARLVAAVIGSHVPSSVRTGLAIEVVKLWPEATPDELRAALERWDNRTGIGPSLLPGLLADIRKEARGATTRASPAAAMSPTDRFAEQFLAAGRTEPPALRALPGGA